jgi:hypothetical protein
VIVALLRTHDDAIAAFGATETDFVAITGEAHIADAVGSGREQGET